MNLRKISIYTNKYIKFYYYFRIRMVYIINKKNYPFLLTIARKKSIRIESVIADVNMSLYIESKLS